MPTLKANMVEHETYWDGGIELGARYTNGGCIVAVTIRVCMNAL